MKQDKTLRSSFCVLPRRSNNGFTLVELLVALAILAVIVTAIYATLFNVLSTRENIQTNIDRMRSFRRFSAIFTKEVRSSFFSPSNSLTIWQGTGGASSSLSLGSISMTFFTYPTGHARSGDLMAVSYSAAKTDRGISLFREFWNPYTGQRGEKAEVMEDIRGFRALFYNGEKWVESWDGNSEKAPPAAVNVIVDIKALGGLKTLSATVVTMVRP